MAPARGGATVEKPGTNFATTREGNPHFSKIDVVCRTQPSGESETRHRVFRIRKPWRFPSANQSGIRDEARHQRHEQDARRRKVLLDRQGTGDHEDGDRGDRQAQLLEENVGEDEREPVFRNVRSKLLHGGSLRSNVQGLKSKVGSG